MPNSAPAIKATATTLPRKTRKIIIIKERGLSTAAQADADPCSQMLFSRACDIRNCWYVLIDCGVCVFLAPALNERVAHACFQECRCRNTGNRDGAAWVG